MKLAAVATGAVVLALSGAAFAAPGGNKGNGLPHGVDMSDSYKLIIQARPAGKCPGGDFVDSGRRMIVVEGVASPSGAGGLNNGKDGKTSNDILLTSGPDFSVLDGNACDDDEAAFELPADVATTYQVFIKLIGKPNEATAAQLCATATKDDLYVDATQVNTGEYYCSITTVRVRNNGQDTFKDVTSDLLYLDGSVPLFAAFWQDWLWDWEATDKAKAQLVFVPVVD